MEAVTKIKSLIKTLIDIIKAPSELKNVKQELEQIKREKESLGAKILELAEESGKLKGELSAKTKEAERLNREMTSKDSEMSRLRQEITALTTNFEEKVYAEAERRVHLYIPEIIREIKESFISKLSKDWEITCDKCHQRFPIMLSVDGVARLLKDGYIDVECLNNDCKDTFFILQFPHKIRMSLQMFVGAVIKERFEEIYVRR